MNFGGWLPHFTPPIKLSSFFHSISSFPQSQPQSSEIPTLLFQYRSRAENQCRFFSKAWDLLHPSLLLFFFFCFRGSQVSLPDLKKGDPNSLTWEFAKASKMASKPWLYPAPTYRPLETYWDTDDDAPGSRCGHTLTAVAATKAHGPRLILFGGATAIEGGSSPASPGISNSLSLYINMRACSSSLLLDSKLSCCCSIRFWIHCRVGWCHQFGSFLWCAHEEVD